ncbi:hypothetical protein QBC43DRAFT_325213 [Cladorrhinum sp. PSN259]|nr:hypothetical protein QBC43DRAFT_325213 [Cladorrhinum sp. PSN259]
MESSSQLSSTDAPEDAHSDQQVVKPDQLGDKISDPASETVSFPPEFKKEGYHVGQILDLNILSDNENSTASTSFRVRVRQIFGNTLSCVMVVDIQPSTRLPAVAVLKLYDRRFAVGIRENRELVSWTREVEEQYAEFVKTGGFDSFIQKIHQRPEKERYEPQEDEWWDDDACEAALADELNKLHKTETSIYKVLRNVQGRLIPKVFAHVELDIAQPGIDRISATAGADGLEPFKVKGILMQHIEGFTLREIPHRCHRSAWQDIADQALAVVRVCDDYNIINYDIRLDNFVVSECKPGVEYQVYMIDFGMCRVRRKGESDFEWGREKTKIDEDGVVPALVGGILLRDQKGFELGYKPSQRWERYRDGEKFRYPECEGWVLETRENGDMFWVHPEYEGTVRHEEY